MTIDSQRAIRIKNIEEGPWRNRGEYARNTLAPLTSTEKLLKLHSQKQTIRRASPGLARRDEVREAEFLELLRPHWVSDIYEDELPLRDSLDEELTIYQLYELAIETGYLRVDEIEDRVRESLVRLLWSKGAQQFVQDYDYLAVEYLASRLELQFNFPNKTAPTKHDDAEGQFAAFLSQYRDWDSDEKVQLFLRFLDDYSLSNNRKLDKARFLDFLQHPEIVPNTNDAKLFSALIIGFDSFASRIAELHGALSVENRPLFGLVYSYWMALLFGYELTSNGYKRADKFVDWAASIISSKRLKETDDEMSAIAKLVPSEFTDILPTYLGQLSVRLNSVRDFWDATRHFLNRSPVV